MSQVIINHKIFSTLPCKPCFTFDWTLFYWVPKNQFYVVNRRNLYYGDEYSYTSKTDLPKEARADFWQQCARKFAQKMGQKPENFKLTEHLFAGQCEIADDNVIHYYKNAIDKFCRKYKDVSKLNIAKLSKDGEFIGYTDKLTAYDD